MSYKIPAHQQKKIIQYQASLFKTNRKTQQNNNESQTLSCADQLMMKTDLTTLFCHTLVYVLSHLLCVSVKL